MGREGRRAGSVYDFIEIYEKVIIIHDEEGCPCGGPILYEGTLSVALQGPMFLGPTSPSLNVTKG